METASSYHQDETLTNVPQPQNGASVLVKPCRYFLYTGWCSFGSKCRFSHCQKPLPVAVVEFLDAGSDANAERRKSEQSGQHAPQMNSDRRKPCWFFKHGRCHFGEKCRHRHISVSDTRVDVTEQQRPASSEAGQHSQTNKMFEPKGTSTAEKEAQDVNLVRHVALEVCSTPQTSSEISRSAQKVVETSDKHDMLRTTEITQLRRRYPKAAVTDTEDGCTVAKFIFEPSDPDWVMTLRHCILLFSATLTSFLSVSTVYLKKQKTRD